MSARTLWIPRTPREGFELATPFLRAGWQVHYRPWLEYRSCGTPGPAGAWPADYRALLFTSPRAVAQVVTRLEMKRFHGPVFAVGDGTAAALRAAGVPFPVPGGGNAAALADLVVDLLGKPDPGKPATLLFPCNAAAADTLESRLNAAGWQVERWETYAGTPLPPEPAELDALFLEGVVPLFTSPAQVRVVSRALGTRPRPAAALCLGAVTGKAGQSEGWTCQVAATPDPAGLFAAARAAGWMP